MNDPKFLNSLPKLIIVSELLNIEIDANNLEKLVKASNDIAVDLSIGITKGENLVMIKLRR
ncbi:hypothetical protein [Saccharolobus islandicus]|uniref:Uncharacterized protein n=2 Tax=Saccharolobus islandicus TaxID=43080 RepID=C3MVR0_SACI4|nr:hypothetical protein [Sulfolobus islandicus]ACP37497.1 hypothetical protein M1425_2849 [Sulfolobus islandicus M.14.25]ACP54641.1 hypothetical protein M1627_0679 [Sulfolobus islandicus M.16.27]